MRRRSALGAFMPLLLGLAAAGCLRDPDPFSLPNDEHSIYLILEAGSDSVVALVTRSSEIGAPTTVSDAEIHLTAGESTVLLEFDPSRDCMAFSPEWLRGRCYRAELPTRVIPGAIYDLDVIFGDGTHATGRTVIPSPAELTAPAAGAALIFHCGHPSVCRGPANDGRTATHWSARWSAPAQEAGAGVVLLPTRVFLDDESYPGAVCGPPSGIPGHSAGEDAAVWLISIDCQPPAYPARFDSIRAELVLTTRNGQYRRYLEAIEAGETLRPAAASEGLEGAWGVFGATASDRRIVTLVRDPPPGANEIRAAEVRHEQSARAGGRSLDPD